KSAATRVYDPNLVPNLIGLDKISTTNIGNKLNLHLIHKGMGVVSTQNPTPGTPLSTDLIIKLEYSPPNYE
ncbi:MAG: hypothetical protein Q7U04_04335, partial [Bacteriovorax sp.]|nr:hypothetical protein [Bacteriovorax sp.]